MTTLAEHMIVAEVDNCPHMLEKTMYTSWSSRATNIVLQGLSPDVYSLINHHNVAKEIWDRVRLHMVGTKLTYQERECKLYNEFDRFTSLKGESLHEYYLRFAQLMNDMHIIKMIMQQQPQAEFSQLDSSLAVASLLPGDDPISSLNKAMAFLSTAITLRFPITNNQLKTSSNPRNQATIQDGRVTVQQVKGKQGQIFTGMGSKINATSSVINRNGGNNASFQARVEAGQVLDEEKLAFLEDSRVSKSQDTQTTITYNAAFQTDDLNAFDSDYDEAPSAKVVLMANLSSYDLDVISEVPFSETNQDNSVLDNYIQEMYYSEEPTFDPTLEIEITSDSNIISYDQYLKETESAAVQNNTSNEQQNAVIISVFEEITNRVAKCNAESIQNKNVNESLTTELDRYKERVRMFEERQKVDLNEREKYIDSQMNVMIRNRNVKFAAFQTEIDTLKFTLLKNVNENESLMTTIDVLKKQTKGKEDKYIQKEIDLEKQNKELENIVYKVGQSAQTMYMLTKP
ncbi:hypothetical protein Tco_0348805 [Tanacetum coccineum]